MVIKIKYIILLFPLVIICLIMINVFSIKETPVRSVASTEMKNNLSFAFKVINQYETPKEKNTTLENFKKAHEDINFLIAQTLNGTPEDRAEIDLRIRNNRDLYNEVLSLILQDALWANDEKRMSLLFSLSASIPIGSSPIQNQAENILLDLAGAERPWNEELFRNALQFYYIQNFIQHIESDALLEHFVEKCSDVQLRKKIIAIDKEINIYSKKKEVVK